jgi:ParB/RepB/Spo0J family partition protein
VQLTLSQLLEGGDINPRTVKEAAGVSSLMNSIEAVGLITPLRVRPAGDKYQVVDGNRRFAALKKLAKKQKVLPSQFPVECYVVSAGDTLAAEQALVANIERAPLHIVDQLEAFTRLAEGGMNPAQIAARFTLTERQVKQVLALGGLIPEIRHAWKTGKIDEAIARSYTIAPAEKQLQVWTQLGPKADNYRIRQELGGRNDWKTKEMMRCVGKEEYLAAGGTMIEDLFSDEVILGNPELLLQLYKDALHRLHAQLEGFGITEQFIWDRHQAIKEDWTNWRQDDSGEVESDRAWFQRLCETIPEDKRSSYCIQVRVTEGGFTFDDIFKVKDGEKAGVEDEDEIPSHPAPRHVGLSKEITKNEAFATSEALKVDVFNWRTRAFQAAFAENPGALLEVAIGSQITTYNDAWNDKPREWEVGTFKPWPHEGDAGVYDIEALVTRWAEKGCLHINARSDGPAKKLAEVLDQNELLGKLRQAFDAQQYFDRAPKRIAVECMVECCGQNVCISTKKDDIAGMAVEVATFTGWLPPAMRIGVEEVYQLEPWVSFFERKRRKEEAERAAEKDAHMDAYQYGQVETVSEEPASAEEITPVKKRGRPRKEVAA